MNNENIAIIDAELVTIIDAWLQTFQTDTDVSPKSVLQLDTVLRFVDVCKKRQHITNKS